MAELTRVKRANVILDIKTSEVPRYLDLGYSVIDASTGDVLQRAIPRDITSLTAYYHEAEAKIAKLEKENESLKAELKELKKPKTTAKKKTVKEE